jgi:ribonuclease P protein component
MQTFKKHERLKREKIIELLFSEGKHFWKSPFKVVWINHPLEGLSPAQILVVVPKKKIRKAVNRNLIKRRIREAYRLHKYEFYNCLNKHENNCALAIIYTADEILPYTEIEEKIILVLQRLQKDYEKGIG